MLRNSIFIGIIILLVSMNFLNAQESNLEIYNKEGVLLDNGAELYSFSYSATSKILRTDSLFVKNVSNQSLNIKVRKNELEVMPGTFNIFTALSQSMTASDYITPNLYDLASGETLPREAGFIGSYYHQRVFGTTTVLYSFLSIGSDDEVLDSVFVIYHFFNTSITLFDADDHIFQNQEKLITGDPTEIIEFPIKLLNHSNDTLYVRVSKEIIQAEEGHEVYFSWGGIEYGVNENESSEIGERILSKDTLENENGFHAFFDAHGFDSNELLTKAKFSFFNADDPIDRNDITIIYSPSGVGFSDISDYKISLPFPNPTSDYFDIQYDIPSDKMVELKIFNTAGSLISKGILQNQLSHARFQLQNFTSGVYFLLIEVNGQPVATEKLIVE